MLAHIGVNNHNNLIMLYLENGGESKANLTFGAIDRPQSVLTTLKFVYYALCRYIYMNVSLFLTFFHAMELDSDLWHEVAFYTRNDKPDHV